MPFIAENLEHLQINCTLGTLKYLIELRHLKSFVLKSNFIRRVDSSNHDVDQLERFLRKRGPQLTTLVINMSSHSSALPLVRLVGKWCRELEEYASNARGRNDFRQFRPLKKLRFVSFYVDRDMDELDVLISECKQLTTVAVGVRNEDNMVERARTFLNKTRLERTAMFKHVEVFEVGF